MACWKIPELNGGFSKKIMVIFAVHFQQAMRTRGLVCCCVGQFPCLKPCLAEGVLYVEDFGAWMEQERSIDRFAGSLL